MAKRYVDTEMWKKKWFRKLSPKMKNAWLYLITMCNHAGLYEVDIDLMSVFIGEKITEDEVFRSGLATQVEILDDDKWYLPKFIKFQYNVSSPNELNPNNRVHKSVIDILNTYGFLDEARKAHTRPFNSKIRGLQGSKDKDKDKDSNNRSNKIKRKVFKKPTEQEVKDYCDERGNTVDPARFLSHYESKGWMVGKNKMVDWKASVRTWEKNDFNKDSKKSRVFVEPEHRKERGW